MAEKTELSKGAGGTALHQEIASFCINSKSFTK